MDGVNAEVSSHVGDMNGQFQQQQQRQIPPLYGGFNNGQQMPQNSMPSFWQPNNSGSTSAAPPSAGAGILSGDVPSTSSASFNPTISSQNFPSNFSGR